MFEAVRAYLAQTNDWGFVRDDLFGVLAGIIEWYGRGTRFGIKVDDDGLLCAGERGVQLTWMDATIGECVVTPRQGKPVEVQALWYNALRVMEGLADRCDAGCRAKYADSAEHARASFNEIFWNESAGCLYDVVDRDVRDGSVRPNQILAVSLPHSMLDVPRVGDLEFLERVLHQLILNFYWWVNRKDAAGRNIFQGGFLGLDNIGVFDRSSPLPTGGRIN
jgi:predicted glycogen debranching enzyme